MSVRDMENRQDILTVKLEQHDLEDLKQEVRQIYELRKKMQLMTSVSIFDHVDILTANL